MPEHISKQFDQELEAVRARVLQMGGLVEEQIINAMEALASGNGVGEHRDGQRPSGECVGSRVGRRVQHDHCAPPARPRAICACC